MGVGAEEVANVLELGRRTMEVRETLDKDLHNPGRITGAAVAAGKPIGAGTRLVSVAVRCRGCGIGLGGDPLFFYLHLLGSECVDSYQGDLIWFGSWPVIRLTVHLDSVRVKWVIKAIGSDGEITELGDVEGYKTMKGAYKWISATEKPSPPSPRSWF